MRIASPHSGILPKCGDVSPARRTAFTGYEPKYPSHACLNNSQVVFLNSRLTDHAYTTKHTVPHLMMGVSLILLLTVIGLSQLFKHKRSTLVSMQNTVPKNKTETFLIVKVIKCLIVKVIMTVIKFLSQSASAKGRFGAPTGPHNLSRKTNKIHTNSINPTISNALGPSLIDVTPTLVRTVKKKNKRKEKLSTQAHSSPDPVDRKGARKQFEGFKQRLVQKQTPSFFQYLSSYLYHLVSRFNPLYLFQAIYRCISKMAANRVVVVRTLDDLADLGARYSQDALTAMATDPERKAEYTKEVNKIKMDVKFDVPKLSSTDALLEVTSHFSLENEIKKHLRDFSMLAVCQIRDPPDGTTVPGATAADPPVTTYTTRDIFDTTTAFTQQQVELSCASYNEDPNEGYVLANIVGITLMINNCKPELKTAILARLEGIPLRRQGPALIIFMIRSMHVRANEKHSDIIKSSLTKFKVSSIKGENMEEVVRMLRSAHAVLQSANSVPNNFVEVILKIFATTSNERYNDTWIQLLQSMKVYGDTVNGRHLRCSYHSRERSGCLSRYEERS